MAGGHALTKALGYQAIPEHFTGGKGSTCFRVLKEFGYDIVPQGEAREATPSVIEDDRDWAEGVKRGRWHLRSERKAGLAAAKRNWFLARHGKLFCENCKMEPQKAYGKEHGDACIEVHHAAVSISAMKPGHRTKLEDLQCLCANCHRVEHRRMRMRRNPR